MGHIHPISNRYFYALDSDEHWWLPEVREHLNLATNRNDRDEPSGPIDALVFPGVRLAFRAEDKNY